MSAILIAGVARHAVAHDALSVSNPVDGATVDAPPASVDLTFNEAPLTVGAEVQVTAPDGAVAGEGPAVITEATVSQPLRPDLPAGLYQVLWRVTSGDGHPSRVS